MEGPPHQALAGDHEEGHDEAAAQGPEPTIDADAGRLAQFAQGESGGIAREALAEELVVEIDAAVVIGEVEGVVDGDGQGNEHGPGNAPQEPTPIARGLAGQA